MAIAVRPNGTVVVTKVDVARIEALGHDLLVALGEDPTRPGLRDTPRRWAKAWQEFVEFDPGNVDTRFEAVQADQLVVVSDLNIYSLCEHHLMPFSATVAVGVITRERILGLSKYARVVQQHAHRLQIQERLVDDIAVELTALAETPDVAVLARGRHLCMEMRGIRTAGVLTTSVLRGAFREEGPARAEFLRLAL
jgi:GTP cyclohydrolase I